MANDPYNDPMRFAKQAADRAAEDARRASERSREIARQAAETARKNAERFAKDSADWGRKVAAEQRQRDLAARADHQPTSEEIGDMARHGSDVQPDTSRRRGGLLGFLIVIGLVVLGAYLLSQM